MLFLWLIIISISRFKGIYAVVNGIFSKLKTIPRFCQHGQIYEKEVNRKFWNCFINTNEVHCSSHNLKMNNSDLHKPIHKQ